MDRRTLRNLILFGVGVWLGLVLFVIVAGILKATDNSEVLFHETPAQVTHDTLDPEQAPSSTVRGRYVYPSRQVVERRMERISRSRSATTEPRSSDPAPAPTAVHDTPEAAVPVPANASTWDRLADCESGDWKVQGSANWHINTGNGYYGGLQFSLRSWRYVGGTGYPHNASRETQIAMGERLKARQGWGAWPACSKRLGLR